MPFIVSGKTCFSKDQNDFLVLLGIRVIFLFPDTVVMLKLRLVLNWIRFDLAL